MAHFWKSNDSGDWVASPIANSLTLLNEALNVVESNLDAVIAQERVILRRLANPPETWAVLCPPHSELRVNGDLVPLGIAVLSDRDELRVPRHAARFFSTETLAHIEPFPDTAGGGHCPRCKLAIEAGSAAVRCPACGLWHHSADEMPCWSYAPTCAGCAQQTALDAGFRWTPEDL